jgi:uncharacterized protein (TIGR02145 family)
MKSRKKVWSIIFTSMFFILILNISCKKEVDDTITDADGNVYKSVTIGTQVWTSENLKTTKFNDGTAIPLVTNGASWGELSTPGFCWYKNDTTYKNDYGALYNWYAMNTGKLCPTGWHVPTDSEWTTLTYFLGGNTVAGGKLKETGSAHWKDPNTGATNETGFTARPGGSRYIYGSFGDAGCVGYWWSYSEYFSPHDAAIMSMYCSSSSVYNLKDYVKQDGFSVRCLRN